MKAIAIVLAAFFLGCASTATAKKSPFSDTIGHNLNLTDCQHAEARKQMAMQVHDNLIRLDREKITDPDEKEVVEFQIMQLYDYVQQVQLWESDNCASA